MNKIKLTAAILGLASGSAMAQSAIIIYGSVDGGLRYQTNNSVAGPKFSLGSNGTYSSNRLGFRGVEDLGGGTNAHFVLETGFNLGTGALNNTSNQLFERAAAVGLGGAWGSLDLGRQFSLSFKTIAPFDPFNVKYLSIIPATAATAGSQGSKANPLGFGVARFNNDIQYTGVFGPVTAYAEYALGEVSGDTTAGRGAAVGAVYADGPLSVGFSYTARKINPSRPYTDVLTPATATAAQDNALWMAGVSYKIGSARLSAGHSDEKQDWSAAAGGQVRARNSWAGVAYALKGGWEVTGAWYQVQGTYNQVNGAEGTRNLYIGGLTYALSKRTNLYAEIDKNRYKDAAIVTGIDNQLGMSCGVNHMF